MARTSKFTETEQQETVRNWVNSNETAAVVAARLRISVATLYLWKQKYVPPVTAPAYSQASLADMQARLDNMRLANERLRNLLRTARATVDKATWDKISLAYSKLPTVGSDGGSATKET